MADNLCEKNMARQADRNRIKGKALCTKKNKTAEEELVVKEWKFLTTVTKIIVLVLLIISTASVTIGFSGEEFSYSVHRTGTVENDMVRYTQNIHKYISLASLGIEPTEVNEGDKILLLFDTQDNLVKAIPKGYEIRNFKILIPVITWVTMCILMVFIIIMERYVWCKNWNKWVQSPASESLYYEYLEERRLNKLKRKN